MEGIHLLQINDNSDLDLELCISPEIFKIGRKYHVPSDFFFYIQIKLAKSKLAGFNENTITPQLTKIMISTLEKKLFKINDPMS